MYYFVHLCLNRQSTHFLTEQFSLFAGEVHKQRAFHGC